MTSISPNQVVLALVLILRLVEFWLSRINAERRLADGSIEHGETLHGAISLFHAIWLAVLVMQVDLDAEAEPSWLTAAVALLLLRAARLFQARRHWTWRLLTGPGDLPAIDPTQNLRGLAYMPMLAELLVIPLVFGLKWISLAGAVIYGCLAWQRAEMERRLGITRRG